MKRATSAAILAVCIGPSFAAAATFVPVGQTRSVVSSTNTTASTGGSDQESDAAPANGPYTGSKTASLSLTFPTNAPPGYPQTGTVTGTATAAQTSTVSADLLSATGTSYASSVGDINAGSGATTTSTATSTYTVQFTVPVPTPVVLAGSLTGYATYHLGPLERIDDGLSLTGSTAGTLYSLAYDGQPASGLMSTDPASFNAPASFTALLTPGQTYTLSASTATTSTRVGVGVAFNAPGNAGFTVSLTAVPEPASAGLAACGGFLLARRRRPAMRCQVAR